MVSCSLTIWALPTLGNTDWSPVYSAHMATLFIQHTDMLCWKFPSYCDRIEWVWKRSKSKLIWKMSMKFIRTCSCFELLQFLLISDLAKFLLEYGIYCSSTCKRVLGGNKNNVLQLSLLLFRYCATLLSTDGTKLLFY